MLLFETRLITDSFASIVPSRTLAMLGGKLPLYAFPRKRQIGLIKSCKLVPQGYKGSLSKLLVLIWKFLVGAF